MPKHKQPKLTRIRKLWGKGLRSLALLDGHRIRGDYEVKPLPAGLNTQFDVTEDDVNEIAKLLGDDALARRVRQLQHSRFPYGTVPELIMVDFLEKRGERYKYQAQLFGGWRGGGLVPDFVVSRGGKGRAILINGNYWHNIPGKKVKDAADKLRLINAFYEGELITEADIIWESKIMQPNPGRERALDNVLVGIEEGP